MRSNHKTEKHGITRLFRIYKYTKQEDKTDILYIQVFEQMKHVPLILYIQISQITTFKEYFSKFSRQFYPKQLSHSPTPFGSNKQRNIYSYTKGLPYIRNNVTKEIYRITEILRIKGAYEQRNLILKCNLRAPFRNRRTKIR